MVVHAYNPSTFGEDEVGELWVGASLGYTVKISQNQNQQQQQKRMRQIYI
jgi:hypothetical protein